MCIYVYIYIYMCIRIWIGTSEVLATAVSGALKANYAKYASAYKTHAQSDALKAASYRCIFIYVCICIHIYIYVNVYISLYARSIRCFESSFLYVSNMRVYTYIYIYVNIYIYIYIHRARIGLASIMQPFYRKAVESLR
jgi:hypothetical protein